MCLDSTGNEKFPDTTLSLEVVRKLFRDIGVRDLKVKELAWNHDSKRQIYLTTDLSAFQMFPNEIEEHPDMPSWIERSAKPTGKNNDRIHGYLNYYWLTLDGHVHHASHAKLIYYPQYPEVRLSGFLLGVGAIPAKYLRAKSGETYSNRLLFIGTKSSGETIAFLAVGQNSLLNEVQEPEPLDFILKQK
jgi:hypothetical protein